MKIIYTDGSHLKHTTGRLGIGGILVDGQTGQVLEEFSETLEIDWLKKTYGTSDVSNPTCEMIANLRGIQKFGPLLGPGEKVIMRADYTGVQNFNNGSWKAKLPYIRAIKEDTAKEVTKQGLGGRIIYEWVKGHQSKSCLDLDARMNDRVDKLAKGEI